MGPHRIPARDASEILEQYLAEERSQRIDEVIEQRSFDVCVVLDQVHDHGNESAVMRSAEAFGFTSVHLISNSTDQKMTKRVTRGADKWLEIERWDHPLECVDELQRRDYQVVVTSLDCDRLIQDVDLSAPTALVFGNERDGVSQEIIERADLAVRYPMHGFSQSFNISVAAALCLAEVVRHRTDVHGSSGNLTARQAQILKAHYLRRAIRHSDSILTQEWSRRLDERNL